MSITREIAKGMANLGLVAHAGVVDAPRDLFDRQIEQEVLAAAVREAQAGRGRFIAIESQAGMGKTALLRYAGDLARQEGLHVLTARGMDLEQDFSFGMTRQLFESALASVTPEQQAVLLSGAAGVAKAVVSQDSVPGGPLPGEFAILHGLFWLTANFCQEGPLVLLLDDAHWADAPSLRFLCYLLPRLNELALLVVFSLRPGEPEARAEFLDQIITDQTCTLLRPTYLGDEAVDSIVRQALGAEAEREFIEACRKASNGNPLLLHEAVRAISTEKIAPTAVNADFVEEVGGRALFSRVSLRLKRLPAQPVALARAVAMLGDGELAQAAAVAGMEAHEALSAAALLSNQNLLEITDSVPLQVRFPHPLLRAAIYQDIDSISQNEAHRRIARLLVDQNADDERAAAHLLRTSPIGESWVVAVLDAASSMALARGSPGSAATYLKRCLDEPLQAQEHTDVLTRLGNISTHIDFVQTAEYLQTAFAESDNSVARAKIAITLTLLLAWQERNDEALKAHATAVNNLDLSAVELHQQLQAGLLDMALDDPVAYKLVTGRMRGLLAAPPEDTASSRVLDCLLALHEAFAGTDAKSVAQRARRGLSNSELAIGSELDLPDACRVSAIAAGSFALSATELDDVLPLLERYLKEAHQFGTEGDAVAAYTYRSREWLWRGSLAEALNDARQALRLTYQLSDKVEFPFALSVAISALIEQGNVTEATDLAKGLDIFSPRRIGHWSFLRESYGQLLACQHRYDKALEAMLLAGESFAATGGRNPAFTAWRSGAAKCLHALGENSKALTYVEEEIALSRSWGAPRPLGHALRTAGLIAGGTQGVALLTEALEVLENSTARLELAHVLVDLGTITRQKGSATEARHLLGRGLDLASQCAATGLVESAYNELVRAGARPRRLSLTGPQALTPSERRVAELAALGLTNRDIAQQLYVAVKTVEVHLGSTYRKLGIANRHSLTSALQDTQRD
ncbi:helix-turn-helix transcriptional regulator [Streptomyces sp. NPDC002306]